jgi:Holliday junction resolvasome RuvABC endonuclease subunit
MPHKQPVRNDAKHAGNSATKLVSEKNAESSDTKHQSKSGGRKRVEPCPTTNNNTTRLWSEGDVEVFEKQASAEMARQGRKKAMRARKRAKKADAAEELEDKCREAQVIIALDMSTSPGLAIADRSGVDVAYELVGFAQTDKQQSMFDLISSQNKTPGRIVSRLSNGCRATLQISRAPKEGRYANNTEYYELITSRLMDCIRPYADKRCLVILEAYAFHIHSSSVTALAELGGVIRNKLFQAKLAFLEVSPTSIKKWFTGMGTADKPQMWKQFQELAPKVQLQEWLPAPFSDTKIPSPHQDIVDAFASAHSLHTQSFKSFKNFRNSAESPTEPKPRNKSSPAKSK